MKSTDPSALESAAVQLPIGRGERGRDSSGVRTVGASLVLIVAAFSFQIATLRPGHRWGDDFAMYIHHAENIVHGDRYADTGYIFNLEAHVGPPTYPPVFPLFLAPVYAIFGLDFTPMKVEVAVFFAGALFLIGLLLRREMPLLSLLGLLAILGFSPYYWQFKDDVLSDVPFLFFLALALLLIHRAPDWERRFRWKPVYPALLGVALYLAVGTRAVGLALIPTLAGWDFIRTRRLTRMMLIPFAVLVTFLGTQRLIVGGGGGYELFPSAAFVLQNLKGYAVSLERIWRTDPAGTELPLLFWTLVVFALVGFVVRLRQRITVIEIWPLMYPIPLLLWHGRSVGRYLIPWIPFFVFFALIGAGAAGRLLRTRLGRPALIVVPTILIAGIFVSYGRLYARADFGPITGGPTSPAAEELWTFVKTQTSPQDVFVFRKPRALSLFTGRPASSYHETGDQQELWAYMREIRARYVIVSPLDHRSFRRFVRDHQAEMTEVFSVGNFIVYGLT